MTFRFLAPRTLALLGASLAFAATAPAWAATVTVREANISRDPKATHLDQTTAYWISRADCLADQIMNFPLLIADYLATPQLEVWVAQGSSTDCRDPAMRSGTTARCWQVYTGAQSTTDPTISIRVQDIVSTTKIPSAINMGTDASCTNTTTGAQDLSIYFMFIASSENKGGAVWATKMDLRAPDAPTGVTLGIGNTLLKPEWTVNSDPDVYGYRFFCDPPPGTAPTMSQTFDAGAPTTTTGSSGGGGAPVALIEADAATDDAAADAGGGDGTGGAGGSGGTGSSSSCVSINLIAGLEPTEDFINKFKCGDTAGPKASSGIITGVANGTLTNVAVASFDLVGNVGPLSSVTCAAAQEVNGFDELYHKAGGTAGGGFCSIGPRRGAQREAWLGGLSLMGIALALRRRRSTSNCQPF